MATFNGAAHLEEQLQSIAAQRYGDWRLTISDDGSADETATLARRFAEGERREVDVVDGPRRGFAENFLSMIRALPDDPGFVAFSDQDDLWLREKLTKGLARLSAVGSDAPALYGSASWVWNANANRKSKTRDLRRPPSFANALIENFATGNTMILNPPAARLLRDASTRVDAVFAHDWWAYALISGCGGAVVYDDEPSLLYRQHEANEIGAGETWARRLRRDLSVADGRYKRKVDLHLAALAQTRDLLSADAVRTLDAFAAARETSPAILRLARIVRSGVRRQFPGDALGFHAAAFLGKV